MKIFVSNLAADITEEELRMLFECFGQVASLELERSQGRALLEMPDKAAAREAVAGLQGQNLKGNDLVINDTTKRPGGNQAQRNKRPRRRTRRR